MIFEACIIYLFIYLGLFVYLIYLSNSATLWVIRIYEVFSFRKWEEKTPNGKNPHNQVGTENPIHMQGSWSEVVFEPWSTEMKGKEKTTEPL